MRKILISLLVVCLLAMSVMGQNITYPNGNEIEYIDSIITINWTHSTGLFPIFYDLDYSTNNGTSWNNITEGINNWNANITTEPDCTHAGDGLYQVETLEFIEEEDQLYWAKSNTLYQFNYSCDFAPVLTFTGSVCGTSTQNIGLATFIGEDGDRKWISACYNNGTYQYNSTGHYEKSIAGGSPSCFMSAVDCSDTYCYYMMSNGCANDIAKFHINGTFIEYRNQPTASEFGGIAVIDDDTILFGSVGTGGTRYFTILDWSTNTTLPFESEETEPNCETTSKGHTEYIIRGNDVYMIGGTCGVGNGATIIYTFNDPFYEWNTTGLSQGDEYIVRVRDIQNGSYGTFDESDETFSLMCQTDWSCNLWGNCNTSDIEVCIEVVDNNTCGYNYTGNYTEFGTQSCDYCTPSWSCSEHISRCPYTHIKSCLTVTDSNGCYLLTGLPSDDFDGDFSPYSTTCGYNATYDSEDLKEESVDIMSGIALEILFWIKLIFMLFSIGVIITLGGRALGEKIKEVWRK